MNRLHRFITWFNRSEDGNPWISLALAVVAIIVVNYPWSTT